MILSLAFVFIDILDKNIKEKYRKGVLKTSDLQIIAGFLSFLGTFIVLFTKNGTQNPEL